MTLIEQMTLAKVQEVFKEKNYAFFTKGNYNLNIIGVRSPNQVANSFDDYMLVIYKKITVGLSMSLLLLLMQDCIG